MDPAELRHALESTFNEFEDRSYLGMSQIAKCPRYLYSQMVNGCEKPGLQSLRYFHEGYVHEADILERACLAGLAVVNQNRELIAPFDERFRGHIDGEVDGDLVEIKSVNAERFQSILDVGAFFEHMDQCQMYMRYGGYERALIVYKNRDTGVLYVYEMHKSDRHGRRLEEKARGILAAVDDRVPPACTCGRCS
jgi:hypothetical protein